jgi:protocatechuate 3,4-dioxygenase beta subunit
MTMPVKPAEDVRDHAAKHLVLDRRAALSALGILGSSILIGCTSESAVTTDAATSTDGNGSSGGDGGTCAASPEGEIGPYFADDSASGFERSNVLSNLDGTDTQPGVPLTLSFSIYDAKNGCAAMAGAQVDIWHCNASGVYSDIATEQTSTQQWLRGYQISDANGNVTFMTIIPGWYQGRTTHIHVRVRSSYSDASSTTDGSNTTQVFFPQALVDMLATSLSPYNAEGTNPTTNASDRVYSQETKGETLMALAGDVTNGYVATASIYLPITA